jgi:hypothetical protein
VQLTRFDSSQATKAISVRAIAGKKFPNEASQKSMYDERVVPDYRQTTPGFSFDFSGTDDLLADSSKHAIRDGPLFENPTRRRGKFLLGGLP